MRAVVFTRLSPPHAGSVQSLGPLTLDSLVQRLNALPLLCRFLFQREMLMPRHDADQCNQHEEATDPPNNFRNPGQPTLQLDKQDSSKSQRTDLDSAASDPCRPDQKDGYDDYEQGDDHLRPHHSVDPTLDVGAVAPA